MPELMDNNSYEQWTLEGAKDATERALEKARAELKRFDDNPPALDPAVDEALKAFIAKREEVLPDDVF